MPITTLDERTALIVVDLQRGIASLPTAHPADAVIANAAELAAAFRRRDLPVVLVNVAGGAPGRTDLGNRNAGGSRPADWTDLVPELHQQPSDHTVTKLTWGAFHNTSLAAHLTDLGVTQVVVVGIATSIGVESTARAAYEHGFNVTLATDAMTDLDETNHTHSVTNVFPKLGETGPTSAILELLAPTAP